LFSSSNIDPDNQFGEFGTIRNKSFLVLEPKKDEKLFWDGNVSQSETPGIGWSNIVFDRPLPGVLF
jgi:hypothetical protein